MSRLIVKKPVRDSKLVFNKMGSKPVRSSNTKDKPVKIVKVTHKHKANTYAKKLAMDLANES